MIIEKTNDVLMQVSKALPLIMVALLWLMPGRVQAADLNLSTVPPFLGNISEPNVMFTIDDSGSMGWETLPDYPMGSGRRNYRMWSGSRLPTFDKTFSWTGAYLRSKGNGVYYDPKVRYLPWLNADGTSFANAVPSCARHDPMRTGCRNLTVRTSQYTSWLNNSYGTTSQTQTYWPATYYVFTAGPAATPDQPASPPNAAAKNPANYIKVEVQPATTSYTQGGPDRTDCANPAACTYAEEIQNFANWYTYYHTRILTAKAGIGRAFALQDSNMRVGYATINTGSRTIDGVSSAGVVNRGVRHFSGADRTAFFTSLYNESAGGGTPLRRAIDRVGQYYERNDSRGPWSDIPGSVDTTTDSACRQSFNILMTDGYWNGSNPSHTGNIDNTSHTATTTPSTYTYVPSAPYKDGRSSTVADIAMYYWNHDLRTDLNNFVNPNAQDPAYWQHMVNYTVALGQKGTLDPNTDWAGLKAGTTNWPNATSNSPTGIDDVWHAAVNSHGLYFSAKNPTEFANALTTALNDIKGRHGSAAAVALDGAALSANRYVYQSRFFSTNWTGALYAKKIDFSTGTVATVPDWDAQTVMSAQNWDTGRVIVTYKPGTGGVPFRWTDLSGAQQNALKINPDTGGTDTPAVAMNRLNWLRGSPIAGMRSRVNLVSGNIELLGDIVGSSPVFVGKPNLNYPNYWGPSAPENSVAYSSFKSSNASRAERIYVGANDGMLHAFNAAPVGGGNEVFAYVPNTLMKKLTKLTSTGYVSGHQYFVNGSPVSRDVFYGGAWHTVLVGGLGGGGQGIYALDITSPTAATETTTKAKVLWEFDESNDADMGYTFGKPTIARMRNGKWVAIFGNGYNNMVADGAASTTGNAIIYVIDIQTGAVIKKFDTGQGFTQSTTTPKYANGIAHVAAVGTKGDGIVDYVYAGDFQGNVWKIDVTNVLAANWDFAYKTGATPDPLFVATDATGVRQPITGGMDVGRNPSYRSSGLMVYFGTGKYLELADNSGVGQQTQSFYGVWDNGKSGVGRAHLLEQKVLEELPAPTASGYPSRVTTSNAILWHTGAGLPTGTPATDHMGWYIDLANSDSRITFDNKGERYLEVPFLLNGRIIFSSYVPSVDPCVPGGDGWLWELSAESGSRLIQSALDINGDGSVDSNDRVQPTLDINGDGNVDSKDLVAAGASKVLGSKLTISEDATKKIVSGIQGSMQIIAEDPGQGVSGRQSWIKLQ